jgi:hydrogenase-4 membrane subunit HyfE
MSTSADPPATPATSREDAAPATVRAAVALLSVQAVAIAAITVYLVYADLSTGGADPRVAWSVTGFAVLIAVLLAVLARGVARHRRWARDVAVALDLTFLAPAYYMLVGGMAWLGVLVGALALATIAMLVAPSTNRAVGEAGFTL